MSRSVWDLDKLPWLKDEDVQLSKSPVWGKDTVQFPGRWQELIVKDASDDCLDWVERIIGSELCRDVF